MFKGQLNVMDLCLREKQLQGLLVLGVPQDPEYSHLLTFALVPAKEILLSGTTVVPGYNDNIPYKTGWCLSLIYKEVVRQMFPKQK